MSSLRRAYRAGGSILVVAALAMAQQATVTPGPKPEPTPPHLKILLGEYLSGDTLLSVLEAGGQLAVAREGATLLKVHEAGFREFLPENEGSGAHSTIRFDGRPGVRPSLLTWRKVRYARRPFDGEDGGTFRITPLYSVEELEWRARKASPPKEEGTFRRTDLVELQSLDRTIKYDIRYATTNNFMGQKFYSIAKAYLQRPAARAFVRAHIWLQQYGYGLLVHDAYRPWRVTKMFWDATPQELKDFVANPATGSRHNRGCAVDVTLYDRKTGEPVEMVSGYDEFSNRAHPEYKGGTSLQRWHRNLLRIALQREGFTVYRGEWWHFDFKGWQQYRIGNRSFGDLK